MGMVSNKVLKDARGRESLKRMYGGIEKEECDETDICVIGMTLRRYGIPFVT